MPQTPASAVSRRQTTFRRRTFSRVCAAATATATAVGTIGFAGSGAIAAARPQDRGGVTSATTRDGAVLTAEERLSSLLTRRALAITQADPLSLEMLEASRRLMREAADLDPNNLLARDLLLNHADLAEDVEPRAALIESMQARRPDNEGLRLARLRLALDQYQTVESRIEAYESLLAPETRSRLGPAVASRLAYDLAILQRRAGREDEFARWLAEATSLDQTNEAAAATAASFFQARVEGDPYAQAELLVNLLMADPLDTTAQAALARHLLEHGAYEGAARLYNLAVVTQTNRRSEPSDQFVADHAIALWGAGRTQPATDVVRARRNLLDERARMRFWAENPHLTREQRRQIHGARPPALTTVGLALADLEGRTAEVQEELRALDWVLVEDLRRRAEAGQEISDEQRLHRQLERAWLVVWFGEGAADYVRGLLEEARKLGTISPIADQRFAGWIALREGRAEDAVETLAPLVEQDLPAALGHGLALREAGRTRDAARALLAVYRRAPGTVIGLHARGVLESILGAAVPPSDLAKRLDALVAQIPAEVDRFATDGGNVLTLRIEPVRERFGPYDAIPVRLTLTNEAPFPLGISSDGPIQPLVAVQPHLTITGRTRVGKMPPIMIDLNGRLRLDPRETVEVVFDLRRYPAVETINQSAVRGGNVQLTATVNFIATNVFDLQPGAGGAMGRSGLFRVDGIRLSQEWVEAAVSTVSRPERPEDLVTMALLSHVLSAGVSDPGSEAAALLDDGARALAEGFATLDPAARAWLIGVMPPTAERLDPIRQLARADERPLVRVAYLTQHVRSSHDPMLDAAARSEDETIRLVGETVRETLRRLERAAIERAGGR